MITDSHGLVILYTHIIYTWLYTWFSRYDYITNRGVTYNGGIRVMIIVVYTQYIGILYGEI